MFKKNADLFFMSPRTKHVPPAWFGVLYLLRRDVDQCMGINPNTGKSTECRALWPGAMAILAGIDLLAKFLVGSDGTKGVGKRFQCFLEELQIGASEGERKAVYQLRNSLLHSFGLRSESGGTIYRFYLTGSEKPPLVSFHPPDQYTVGLRTLHHEFERSICSYRALLETDLSRQAKFEAMFPKYGRVYIG